MNTTTRTMSPALRAFDDARWVYHAHRFAAFTGRSQCAGTECGTGARDECHVAKLLWTGRTALLAALTPADLRAAAAMSAHTDAVLAAG